MALRKVKRYSKALVGKFRSIYSGSDYSIKPGYKHRGSYNYFDDRNWTDEYQKEVYELVRQEMSENDYQSVIDVGCGSAYKLLNYLGNFKTTGIDVNPTYDYLKEKYPDKEWLNAKTASYESLKADIVVCSDVIEHVLDPDALLNNILKIDFKTLYLSTPERDILHGELNYGPPDNPTHVREWNGHEFRSYIDKYFRVRNHSVTHYSQATQLIICEKLGTSS